MSAANLHFRLKQEAVNYIWIWSVFSVSPETIPTLGMQVVTGRNFSRDLTTDKQESVMINETGARQLGWEDPIGKKIYFGQDKNKKVFSVIGVVKDFHFISLHQPIEPVIIFSLDKNPGGILTARVQQGKIPAALDFAKKAWAPGHMKNMLCGAAAG